MSPAGVVTSVASGTALVTANVGFKLGFALYTVTATATTQPSTVLVSAPRTTLFATTQTQAAATS